MIKKILDRNAASVIHVTHASDSGAARYVYHLVDHLAKSGVRIQFVCPADFAWKGALENNEGIDLRPELPPFRLGSGGRLSKLVELAKISISAKRDLVGRASRNSVFHINFPGHILFTVALFRGIKKGGSTIVFNVHDVYPHKWALPTRFRRFELRQLSLLYDLADVLIVHHDGARSELVNEFGVRADKIHVVPHGPFEIDPPAQRNGGVSRKLRLLLFGRLRENKNILAVIQAVQSLVAESIEVELTIAGEPYYSELEYWKKCKEQIEQNPEGIVVIDRFLTEEEVSDVFSATDIVLVPYSQFESQSGVAIMALSHSKFVLATRTRGLTSLLPPDSALWIEAVDVGAIRDAVERASALGPSALAEWGRVYHSYFLGNVSWGGIASSYAEIYIKLQESGGAHGC